MVMCVGSNTGLCYFEFSGTSLACLHNSNSISRLAVHTHTTPRHPASLILKPGSLRITLGL